MSRAESIAIALGGAKKTADGYLCKCPCHEDKSASLSLKISEKGGIVLHCFAGCNWQDIKAELVKRGIIPAQKQASNAPKVIPNRYDGAIFYIYKDLVGNVLARKVKKTNPKRMWSERFERGQWLMGLEGLTLPLYNIQAVVNADLVYLCEGEKDAETLITRGLVATTNSSGAAHWAAHLSEQLRGKVVVIIPDNDDPGRARVKKVSKALANIAKEIRVFVPDGVPDHGDITDWVSAGGDVKEILPKSIVIEKKQAKKKASRQEYFDLIDTVLNEPRRCIFNDKLMYYENGLWNPAINALDIIRSEALYMNENSETKFDTACIAPHFAALERSRPREFLVNIPDWDGKERIKAMAGLVTLSNDQGISDIAFAELLQEWCGLVFQRLEDPMIQNRMLILQGGQGLGKDTWISMLVDGLGQFCIPWASIKEDKDTYLQLHKGLIMKIPEFDKTRNTETSTLKDIVTAPSTDIRAPYDKDSKIRQSRCSFISSTNPKNILRDSTGNRRYLIFEITKINYAYADWTKDQIRDWQMQCLAEMKDLALRRYKASPASWKEMNDYIERETPGDYSQELAEQFVITYRRENAALVPPSEFEISPTDEKVTALINSLAKQNSIKYRTAKSMLQSRLGIYRRQKNERYWTWKLPAIPEPLQPQPQQDDLPF